MSRSVERIVGLEGVRTIPAFLQRHGHDTARADQVASPAYEGRLPARAGEPTGIRPFPPSRSRTSTRSPPACGPAACDVRGPRASSSVLQKMTHRYGGSRAALVCRTDASFRISYCESVRPPDLSGGPRSAGDVGTLPLGPLERLQPGPASDAERTHRAISSVMPSGHPARTSST